MVYTTSFIEGGRRNLFCATVAGYPRYITEAELDANARLIAAAPDLLAACKAVVSTQKLSPAGEIRAYMAASKLVRAAIAKAEAH